jgi:hypothetical protein
LPGQSVKLRELLKSDPEEFYTRASSDAQVISKPKPRPSCAARAKKTAAISSRPATDNEVYFQHNVQQVPGPMDKLVGPLARDRFFGLAKDLQHERQIRDPPNQNPSGDQHHQIVGVREDYLDNILEERMLAMPLVIRNRPSQTINLQGRGIGDRQAIEFAKSFTSIPDVSGLDMGDNRLTGKSIVPVIQAASASHMLTHLNLSRNKLDKSSAAALAVYLKIRGCALKECNISRSSVSDSSAHCVIDALKVNTSVTSIDISHNQLGQSTSPNVSGAGDALAEMLGVNCTLTTLNMAWNQLAHKAALKFAQALKNNSSLRHINLAYNAVSGPAAEAMGWSLRSAKHLVFLDLSFNNVGSRALVVFASMLSDRRGETLTLKLHGGELCHQSLKAVVRLLSTNGGASCKLELSECGFDMSDPTVFHHDEPAGNYVLDMSQLYDRTVALELLKLSETKPACHFVSVTHAASASKPPRKIKLENKTILQLANTAKFQEVTKSDRRRVETACQRASSGGDVITTEQMRSALKDLRLGHLLGDFKQIVEEYEEQLPEHCADGRMPTELFIEELCTALMELNCHTQEGSSRWIIPESGIVTINYSDRRWLASYSEITPRSRMSGIVRKLQQEADSMQHEVRKDLDTLICKVFCIQPVREMISWDTRLCLTNDQALEILKLAQSKSLGDKLNSLAGALPLAFEPSMRLALTSNYISTEQTPALQAKLGSLFFPLFGNPTGAYVSLDMKKLFDRQTAVILMSINDTEKHVAHRHGFPDTSQECNRDHFRNARLGGHGLVLSEKIYAQLPETGILEIDFVSTTRPPWEVAPIRAAEFEDLLATVAAQSCISDSKQALVENQLGVIQYECVKSWFTVEQAIEIIISFAAQKNIKHCKANKESRHSSIQKRYCSTGETTLLKNGQLFDRVRTIAALFSRLIDLNNFHKLLEVLTFDEEEEVFHRLGWLNVYNPLYTEREYRLDLARPEEREMLKLLLTVSVQETDQYRLTHQGKELDSWVDGEFVETPAAPGAPASEIVRDWDLRVFRLKWVRDPRKIPFCGTIALCWNHECAFETARIALQRLVLCGGNPLDYLGHERDVKIAYPVPQNNFAFNEDCGDPFSHPSHSRKGSNIKGSLTTGKRSSVPAVSQRRSSTTASTTSSSVESNGKKSSSTVTAVSTIPTASSSETSSAATTSASNSETSSSSSSSTSAAASTTGIVTTASASAGSASRKSSVRKSSAMPLNSNVRKARSTDKSETESGKTPTPARKVSANVSKLKPFPERE